MGFSVIMMTSSNGNIFRVTGHLCGKFPTQRPVTRSFDVFFDLRLNKRLSKQPWGWWFETPAWSLWRHRNDRSATWTCPLKGIFCRGHWVVVGRNTWMRMSCLGHTYIYIYIYVRIASHEIEMHYAIPNEHIHLQDQYHFIRTGIGYRLCQQIWWFLKLYFSSSGRHTHTACR